MMDLSLRQRRAVSILLESSHEVTLGALAEVLDVSPRTVHRELSRLGPALEPWGLSVKGRSGQGIQLVGDIAQREAFGRALGGLPDRNVSPSDRRWMTATILLETPGSVKVFALERELGVSTAVVRAELDSLEPWLVPFDLVLIRRRGFGVAIEGSEMNKRLALGASLTERFTETELLAQFRDAGNASLGGRTNEFLSERFPHDLVCQVDGILDEVSRKESWDWAPAAGLILTLHLATTLRRVGAGAFLDPVIAPSGDRGPSKRLIERISQSFGIDFPPSEIEWVSVLIESAKPNRPSAQSHRAGADLVRGVHSLILRVAHFSGHPFDRDAFLHEGLVAHWRPALARLAHRLPIVNDLLPEIEQRFPDLMDLVGKALQSVYPHLLVPREELGFLVLHFAASLERSHRESVPFRALIVCSSGIGTSHMLASRIRAEVPEIEVVANLSWFEVKEFSREKYDLLVATVPLPLPAEDYVVVSPLLDESGLRTLRDYMRRRRLRLVAPETPLAGPSLGALKDWHRDMSFVLDLVEDMQVLNSDGKRSWQELVWAYLADEGCLTKPASVADEQASTNVGDSLWIWQLKAATRSSLSLVRGAAGGWILLWVYAQAQEPMAESVQVLLKGTLGQPPVQSALASGNPEELKAVLARIWSRSTGPRPTKENE